MIDIILRFGPYIFGGLFVFFFLGGLFIAFFDPESSEPAEMIDRRQSKLFILCMAAAVLCLLTLLGCFMLYWESF